MYTRNYVLDVWNSVYANSLDPFVPEVWAMESLMVLHENTVAAQLVHTDFSNEVANSGDVVNTRRPAKFTSKRKIDSDNVTDQDATAQNVAVKLDQHHHVSFVIKDGEESKGMVNLRQTYLEPALQAIAQAIDEVVIGQKYEFLNDNRIGKLGTDPTRSTLIDAQVKADELLMPQAGRNMLVSPKAHGKFLDIDDFLHADKVGDEGTALREGSLGRKFSFNTFMSQNNKTITATTTASGAVNNGSGYSSGATTIAVDGFSGTGPAAGTWITIAGDMTPQLITGTTVSAGSGNLTIYPGLDNSVSDDAVVTAYTVNAVDNGSGYSSGYAKELTMDGGQTPKVGQMVTFGTTSSALHLYSALSAPTSTSLLLNRPLDSSVSDDDVIGLGPAGDYSFGFHRNAISLVSRPLAQPAPGTGALSAVREMNGLGVRVTITYDGKAQGHRVTVDLLAGVKTLDTDLGLIVLS